MNRKSPALIAIGLALAFAGAAQARTVNWGDTFAGSDIQSDGSVITSTFTFEIGTFGAFVPDEDNFDLWLANWKVLDTVTYNDGVDFATSTFQLTAHPTLPNTLVSDQNGTDTFAEGEQAYIWVYNTTVVSPTTEWALFTDNDGLNGNDWVIPAAGDQSTEPLDWRQSPIVDSTPVFGGVNDMTGPGERTATPPTFSIQTHTIPEPSAALLVVGALGLLGARRRRTNTNSIGGTHR